MECSVLGVGWVQVKERRQMVNYPHPTADIHYPKVIEGGLSQKFIFLCFHSNKKNIQNLRVIHI